MISFINFTRTLLNVIKAISKNSTPRLIVNGERLKVLRWGTRQGYPLSPLLFIVLEIPTEQLGK
jgi:hypothetical protein